MTVQPFIVSFPSRKGPFPLVFNQVKTGCCPNPFSPVLKHFLINLRLAPGNAKTRPSGSNSWHCCSSASPRFMNKKRFNELLKGILV
jgi:hypothetical protein